MHGHLVVKRVACKALPLADGYFAVPWIVKGDLEYYANVLGLEHWAKGDIPCMACKVDRGPCFAMGRPRMWGPSVQWVPNGWRAAHPNVHNMFHHVHDTMVPAV